MRRKTAISQRLPALFPSRNFGGCYGCYGGCYGCYVARNVGLIRRFRFRRFLTLVDFPCLADDGRHLLGGDADSNHDVDNVRVQAHQGAPLCGGRLR